MLEITIGKGDYTLKMHNRPFNVNVLNYRTVGNITDMRVPEHVCSGTYLTELCKASNCRAGETLIMLDKAGKLKKPIIVFEHVNIDRELTEAEQYSREAIEQFLKTEIKNTEPSISKTYEQVIRFKEAVELLKNKDAVNKLLPVQVESVAFVVMDNTEEDFILSRETTFVNTWIAPNGNNFNIYTLW